MQEVIFKPQEGFQESALSTSADIAILGGSAGAGKTFTLLLEALRHVQNPRFGCTLFRRTYPQIIMEGGLLDESRKIFPFFGGVYNDSKHHWKFPSGAKISFRHLQYEKNIYDYQGAQIPLIEFDELTHFTENMFLYLLSRNRTDSGVKPYIRATCNPDPDSFVYELIKWWIDPITGFPIPERDGVVRYFVNDNGKYIWGDTKQEVIEKADYLFKSIAVQKANKEDLVKSLTFIKGSINDNKKLLDEDPSYLANLLSQSEEQKLRLLDGNWKYMPDASKLMSVENIKDIFSNEIFYQTRKEKFITIDHARFGNDYCTIKTWEGWKVLRIDVLSKSDTADIVQVVQNRRREYGNIRSSNILVDQDGIGVKDSLRCNIFVGSSKPFVVKKVVTKFENKKAQCWYHLADRVNQGEISVDLDNVWFDGRRVKELKYNGELIRVEYLIEKDLSTMKRGRIEDEHKYRLIPKEEQKVALGGRSPDFGDNLAMRSWFDLAKRPKRLKS